MPAGPFPSLEAARDAAVNVMKYNKRRGAKDSAPAAAAAEAESETEARWKRKYKKWQKELEKTQLEQHIQETPYAPPRGRGGFAPRGRGGGGFRGGDFRGR